MVTQDEADVLWNAYHTARRKVDGAKAGKMQGDENQIGLTYQALVKAGLAQQIKRKYRGR